MQKKFNFSLLGRKLDAERKKQNLTIEELAKKAHVNKNTVVRFLKGIGSRLDTVLGICAVLNLPVSDILNKEMTEGIDYKIIRSITTQSGLTSEKRYNDIEKKDFAKYIDFNDELPNASLGWKIITGSKEGEIVSHKGEHFIFCIKG
ncbi:helix-turn-helix domain-containing protein, partial [Candidatus Latescibacterota bacterium]